MARQLVYDDAVVSGRKRPEAARRPGSTRAGQALRLRPRRRPGLRKTRAWPFLIPVVVWIILMFGYPVIETIRMALSYVNATNFTTGGWKFAGLANFRALPSLQGWHLMLRNTLIFLVASIVPQFIIGGLLAVALTEKSRLRRWGRSLVLLPWLFPQVAVATVFLWMFASPAGLFDSLYKSLGLGHGAWCRAGPRAAIPADRQPPHRRHHCRREHPGLPPQRAAHLQPARPGRQHHRHPQRTGAHGQNRVRRHP
jgi:hypothetical protein